MENLKNYQAISLLLVFLACPVFYSLRNLRNISGLNFSTEIGFAVNKSPNQPVYGCGRRRKRGQQGGQCGNKCYSLKGDSGRERRTAAQSGAGFDSRSGKPVPRAPRPRVPRRLSSYGQRGGRRRRVADGLSA